MGPSCCWLLRMFLPISQYIVSTSVKTSTNLHDLDVSEKVEDAKDLHQIID